MSRTHLVTPLGLAYDRRLVRSSLPGPRLLRAARWLALAATLSVGAPASADPIDEATVVRRALAESPTLAGAVLELSRARNNAIAEESQYGLSLQLEGGATHSERPSATLGGVTTARSDQFNVAAQLNQRFSFGLLASLRVEGTTTTARVNPIPTMSTLITLGPNYGLNARLTLTQPLLRGAFDDYGRATYEAALADVDAATHARARTASELVRDVTTAYWELWYAREAKRVQEHARELANRQFEEATARAERGLGADVDALPFQTRVATLDENVLAASLEERRRSLELGRLMGLMNDEAMHLEAGDAVPDVPDRAPSPNDALSHAMQASYALRELNASLERAKVNARIAGESLRSRLDVTGYVELAGLGAQDFGAPFEQVAQASAFNAHIDLLFEMPLDDTQRRAQRSAASEAVEAAETSLDAAKQTLSAEVRLAVMRVSDGLRRAELASTTVDIARRLYQAETQRYALGTTTPTEVLAAEEELRSAELRVARARVDAVIAQIALDHATGELLDRHESELP